MSFSTKVSSYKNAIGAMFLIVSAFFVCSTLVSIRSVFADPIDQSVNQVSQHNRSPRSTSRNSGRTRANSASRNTVARTAVSSTVSNNKAVSSRSVASRSTANRNVSSRSNSVSSRNVTNRATTRSSARSVRARTATNSNASRVSVTGNVSQGIRASATTSLTYLSSKLYTGNYSNIIDSTTGLIAADAYSNCMESYYTCMDEICTARSAAKRRCSCAARVTSFIEAEDALEAANEELITVSGELALLIATKGKGTSIASAFTLTDAEKVMNCASYAEVIASGSTDEISDWCDSHKEYTSSGDSVAVKVCDKNTPPTYCKTMGTTYGFSLSDLNGSGSDILATLKSWADAKDNATSYISDNTNNLLSAYTNISDLVSSVTYSDSEAATSIDKLANTWGYDLFEYAHNNVCARVLDSCFNGIYEACGTPPTNGKCANGATSSCPYNYNSKISVSSEGDVELNERGSSTGSTTKTSATCFGYTSTSGDPYSSLRGPVADARRGIMQKYLLDANADCDSYGEELKATAQNINYQKVAAQQSLQQKRLEFLKEEQETVLSDATTAISNFNECIGELVDCYEDTAESEPKWTNARIKTYCSQVSNVPHCYETMICSPSEAQYTAIIDHADEERCTFTNDYETTTCRNIVTISEILYGTNSAKESAMPTLDNVTKVLNGKYSGMGSNSSVKVREYCLQRALGCDGSATDVSCIRNWQKSTDNN